MLKTVNILSSRLRKLAFCLFFSGFAVYSFASMGGGEKPKTPLARSFGFSPIKTTNGFTLKAGPSYRGSNIFREVKKTPELITFNALITYQKGNATYILPYKHKVSLTGAKSNLQAVNVKVVIP